MNNSTPLAQKAKGIAIVIGLSLALGGCITGGEPFAYTAIHEIPPGPGLVSGDEGGYVIKLGNNRQKGINLVSRRITQPEPTQPPRRSRRMQEAVTRQ